MKLQTDKSNHTLSNSLLIIAAVVLCALGVRRCHENREILDVEVVHSDSIDFTPVHIRSIENIGEWEFLAIADEELVDSTRHRTLGRDDRLVRIYHGTLRLGIDLSQAREGWVQTEGDSVHLQLPPVRLLSVTAIHLTDRQETFEQLDLLDASPAAQEKQEAVEGAMARIREKYGKDAIAYAKGAEDAAVKKRPSADRKGG